MRQRRNTAKKRGKWYTNNSSNKPNRKKNWVLLVQYFFFLNSKHFLKANAQKIRGQIKVHAVRYSLLMCLLLAAPTSTHGVFTSFSLSQYCCLHFWKNKFGSMLTQGFLGVKGQAKITKCYFLWVDAINLESLSGHYLMCQQVTMVFSLHLVYLSTAACIFEKNNFGSMLAQGFWRVKGQAKIAKCYFLWVDAINMQSLSGHYLMRQQVPVVFYFF